MPIFVLSSWDGVQGLGRQDTCVSLYGTAHLCPCFPGYALAMHKNPSLIAAFLYPCDHATI
jgi:hypothetical protein